VPQYNSERNDATPSYWFEHTSGNKRGELERQLSYIVHGAFQPVLAKHSKHFSLQNALSIGVDQMQRNFDGMRMLSEVAAKLIIYRAFIEGRLDVPKHLVRPVHDLYFNPQHEEFQARTLWSLSNAFTSAFKELEPIPQFRATAKLAGFLEAAPRAGIGLISNPWTTNFLLVRSSPRLAL
jgi:hypothetical protein